MLAWALLSALGWYFGEWLAGLLALMIDLVLRWMAPEFAPALQVVPVGHNFLIKLSALALQPIPLTTAKAYPVGRQFAASIGLLHALLPVVICLSILLAWPVRRRGQRLFLLLAGLAAAPFVIALTSPPLLLGLIEINFQETAGQLNETRPEPLVLSWMIFCEMGGNWLLGLLAAWGCIDLQRRLSGDKLKGSACL